MKVKVIGKPKEWPFVLVNDFKSPPYFAYEITGENGIKSFIPVRKGDTDRSEPTHSVTSVRKSRTKYLSNKRHGLLTQFLKETLEKPKIVDSWLDDSTFNGLIAEIESKLKITETMKKAQMKKNKEQRMKVKKGRVTRSQAKLAKKAASSPLSSLSHRHPISSSSSSSSSSLGRNRISSTCSTDSMVVEPPLSPSPPWSTMSVASSDSDDDLFIPITVRRRRQKKKNSQGMT